MFAKKGWFYEHGNGLRFTLKNVFLEVSNKKPLREKTEVFSDLGFLDLDE